MAQNRNSQINQGSARQWAIINRYYKITRFYTFLKSTAYKGGIAIVFFVLLLLGINHFVLDINSLLNNLVETYSPEVIYSFFLLSETVLGLVPPEIFIAWASKSASPWLSLFILASMSYIGGIIAYLIGTQLFLIPALRNYIENKVDKHIVNLKKWGGFFVVLGAITPLPHSMVSMASGLIKYNFKSYLLWSLFRYLRFFIYALVIFQIF